MVMVLAAQETPEDAIAGADHKSFRGVSLGVCAKQFVEKSRRGAVRSAQFGVAPSLQYPPTTSEDIH